MSDSTIETKSDLGEIIVLNRDLFFGVKIGNILRGLGYRVVFAPTTEKFVHTLQASSADTVLGVIDMGVEIDWPAIAVLTKETGPGIPIIGFGSHLDVDGRRAAKVAGLTRILSNGEFHRDMVPLVERYARKPVPTNPS